jgi:MFS transporter, PPP family, 3-phenylpropionic acid transporter
MMLISNLTPWEPAQPVSTSVVRPAIVYVLLFTAVGAWFPYIPLYYRSIGIGVESIGLLAALWAGMAVVAAPMWGAIADRLGSVRGPLVAAGVVAAAGAAALAFVSEPLAVVVLVGVIGAGTAGLAPLVDSRTLDIVGESRERYGRARAWGSISFIVASIGVGFLLDRTGPRGLFLVMFPAVLLTGIAAYALLGSGGRTDVRRLPWSLSQLGFLRERGLGLFFVGAVLLWATTAAVSTFLSVRIADLGGTSQLVGYAWALGAAVEVPIMFSFPMLARRFGSERLLVVAALAYVVRSAALAVTDDPAILVALAPISGVGFALFQVGVVTYVARSAPTGVRATAQALFSGTAFSLGSIAGSTLGGQLAGAVGLGRLFGLAALGALIAAVVIWWAIIPTRRQLEDQLADA